MQEHQEALEGNERLESKVEETRMRYLRVRRGLSKPAQFEIARCEREFDYAVKKLANIHGPVERTRFDIEQHKKRWWRIFWFIVAVLAILSLAEYLRYWDIHQDNVLFLGVFAVIAYMVFFSERLLLFMTAENAAYELDRVVSHFLGLKINTCKEDRDALIFQESGIVYNGIEDTLPIDETEFGIRARFYKLQAEFVKYEWLLERACEIWAIDDPEGYYESEIVGQL